MSEQTQPVDIRLHSQVSTIKILYILFVVGYFTGGLTSLIAVVMAYMNRGGSTDFERAHFDYLIKIFWISFVTMIVALITWVMLIGMVIALAWFVWSLIKIIKGVSRLGEGKMSTQR